MVGEENLNSPNRSLSNGNLLVDIDGKDICTNGFMTAGKNGTIGDVKSAGSSGNVIRTYKRRRRTKTMEDEKLAMASTSQANDQPGKEPCYKNSSKSSYLQPPLTQVDLHACENNAKSSSLGKWRNVVLEQMSPMLKCEGGLRGCIQDAFACHLQSCRTAAVKGSVHSCEDGGKCSSQTGPTLNKLHNKVCGNEGMVRNGPIQEAKRYNAKDLCQRTFYEVIRSEKFAQLCQFLLNSFPGIKSERVLDISFIDSRMEEGAYENSINLFHADIQQVWTKIEKIGTDMAALAKSLSVISRISFCEQAGSVSLCSTEVGKPDDSDMHGKEDSMQSCDVYNACTCKNCGGKADVRYCLVCDSCEEVHHIACIEPAIKEIPSRSWYCASCTANGMGSPHDDCAVCEIMNAPIAYNSEGACQESENDEDMVTELENNSNDLPVDEPQLNGRENFPICIICRSAVIAGEKLKVCHHAFCPHKFYHIPCLTSIQLETYGREWYCPSCLCASCFTDRDDDKIVLCDGCDHAYHIYCTKPPLTSVPKGKWFCSKCDADVCRIRQAKISYESMHHKLKKTAAGGNGFLNGGRTEETVDTMGKTPEGIDMLLNVVKTLNTKDDISTLVLS